MNRFLKRLLTAFAFALNSIFSAVAPMATKLADARIVRPRRFYLEEIHDTLPCYDDDMLKRAGISVPTKRYKVPFGSVSATETNRHNCSPTTAHLSTMKSSVKLNLTPKK